ncbi:chorismate-binding protein, partial [Pseudomonas aeruginosa]
IKTGQTPEETKALGAQLLQVRKNTGEHQIVVERLAKGLSKMTPSENSIQARIILENRDVQHLYVSISGQRKAGISFLESVMQLHPTP